MTRMAPVSGTRIGELARQAQVSTRTVRYYEQRGLLNPTSHSPGGERRYDATSLARLLRIRELASVLGSDLDEIGAVLSAEDRLAELRSQKRPDDSPDVRLARLDEAEWLNDELQARVTDHQQRLAAMLDELRERHALYRRIRSELRASAPEPSRH